MPLARGGLREREREREREKAYHHHYERGKQASDGHLTALW